MSERSTLQFLTFYIPDCTYVNRQSHITGVCNTTHSNLDSYIAVV